MPRETFVYDHELGRVVPRHESVKKAAGMQIIGEIESFRSPVTGEVISNRRELKNHNRQHEVVDRREMQGHKFEPPKLPSVAPELARAYKEATGKL